MSSKPETKGGDKKRRDFLLEIQEKYQAEWEAAKVFNSEPGKPGEEKYMITFPFPYMNGLLHLGHGFSFSKAEFAAGFQRMKGKKVLLPFGLHVTGTPIAACAEKLKTEMAEFGNPPVFPVDDEEGKAKKEEKSTADKIATGKFSGKKLKKQANKRQWEIMQTMGIPDDKIASYADPLTWLEDFPKTALDDLKVLGSRIDYRRSFITTDQNPYFDSFVAWQFRHLRAKNCLDFGLRYSIFSPLDGQPCQDHDRASGEGVVAQEYTLIMIEVQNPMEQACFKDKECLKGMKVFLPAATLRPETMFGQTNCWILPGGQYHGFQLTEEKVIITTERAALNMAWQDIGVTTRATPTPLFEINGDDMMGLPCSSPNATFETVYTLPMTTISMKKGTGIVTSVPSDAPDDYQALADLKKKPEWRAKLGIKDEWVMPFDIVPIIDIPGYGDKAAEKICTEMKIASQKDQDKLVKAKAEVYLKGFTDGVMTDRCGEWAGKKVKDVKPLIKQAMVDAGQAIIYSEPEGEVISRSGDMCVVALTEQWYLKYGEEKWQAQVKEHINSSLECYTKGTRRGFEETIDWLKEHACSRTFGLGTKLPFGESGNYIIDSLSDSTIYMAYYTICHELQNGARYNGKVPDGVTQDHLNLDGRKPSPSGVKPEELTDSVWDAVFLGTPSIEDLDTTIDKEILKRWRAEFTFWYGNGMDLRVSGKDLIQNHLTMCLYNHAAIFEKEQWPQSFYCNGHVLVDGEKMAKSKGNFLTLNQVVKEYSADATRIALADAGDGLDDANFVPKIADTQILKLTKEIDWCMEVKAKKGDLRTGEKTFFDKVFENAMNKIIIDTEKHYSGMMFREAIQCCWFGLQNLRDEYRTQHGTGTGVDPNLHHDCVMRFIEVQAGLIAPIAPHFAEYLWREVLGKETSIQVATFPIPSAPLDLSLLMASSFLGDAIHSIRVSMQKHVKKTKKTPTNAAVYCVSKYEDWQLASIELVSGIYKEVGEIPKDMAKRVSANETLKKDVKKVMGFVANLKDMLAKHGECVFSSEPLVNEKAVLDQQVEYLKKTLGIATLEIFDASDASAPDHSKQKERAEIGKPSSAFFDVE